VVVHLFIGENTITLPISSLFCFAPHPSPMVWSTAAAEIRSSHAGPCLHHHELPLVKMEPWPAARSQSPYHVGLSGALPAARSKSSPSICCRPEHTSGRTAAFYSCLMLAQWSSSLLQVTNYTSQPSWWVSLFIYLSRVHVRIRNVCL
jgi:hypothetical protein